MPFVLTYGPSHLPPPGAVAWRAALEETEAFWRDWSARCTLRRALAEAGPALAAAR